MQRDGTKPYRIAVVVSKKVSKSAVTRNRIRRRLYEIVRHNDSQLAPGTDIIITIFDEQLATIDASAVERQVLAVLNKVAPPVSHAIVNADTSTKGDK